MKVLIAEDDPVFQSLLVGLIRSWGDEPVPVQNGQEAWAALTAPDGPRLAILDWVMPGLDGVELCRRLRARCGSGYVYILLLTGRSNPEDTVMALEAGADDYVTKPFHPSELRARLRSAGRILELQEALAHQANHDALTGLPNRTLLAELFRLESESALRHSEKLGFLYIDLDRFKLVNDTLGHAAGDVLLKEVSHRFLRCIRKSDTLARVGGDEFVLMTPRLSRPETAEEIAAKLLDALEAPVEIEGHQIYVTASIGISIFPRDGHDLTSVQQSADAAMYASKRSGRNKHRIFDAALSETSYNRLQLDTQLHGALRGSEFLLHYQPLYCLRDFSLAGAEALIRWNNPALGMVAPDTFIPIAEESGGITAIGQWALQQACTQVREWAGRHPRRFRVGVNISATQFASNDFLDTVRATLAFTGVDSALLEFELTETVLVRDFEKSASVIAALHDLGIKIAIDDFGSGYSSFSYLQNLPVDTLKIDKSLVHSAGTNPRSASVLQAITSLAHSLDTRVVAEGIESVEQLQAVRAAGCDMVQGYLLGRPGTAAQLFGLPILFPSPAKTFPRVNLPLPPRPFLPEAVMAADNGA